MMLELSCVTPFSGEFCTTGVNIHSDCPSVLLANSPVVGLYVRVCVCWIHCCIPSIVTKVTPSQTLTEHVSTPAPPTTGLYNIKYLV